MNNKKLIELEKMSIIIEKTSNYIIELIHNNEENPVFVRLMAI